MEPTEKTSKKENPQGRIRSPRSILEHAVYLSVHPGQLLLIPLKHWFARSYRGRYKFERAVFTVDMVLISTVLTLALILFLLILFPLHRFRDDLLLNATVAPHEVMSGGSSTLVITYQNNTKETLRNPKLTIVFPDHFLVQEVAHEGVEQGSQTISLNDIPSGAAGSVHVRGVMFGDVGGKQTFTSTMQFVHGEKNIADQKTTVSVFSPSRSSLSLDLTIPTRTIDSQSITGFIQYKNNGPIDFPEITITPKWPDGFTLEDASAQIKNNAFILPKIHARSEGQIQFSGILRSQTNEQTFTFQSAFTFGSDHYQQGTLTKTVSVLPTQIRLTQSIDPPGFVPGKTAVVHVHYENIGNDTLKNVALTLTSSSPFISIPEQPTSLATLKQHEQGDLTFSIPIRSHVDTNKLTSYDHIHIRTIVTATYSRESASNETLTTTQEQTTPLTTPVNFETFARYTAPGGDQIGRGPLPPRVGQKTSYWIFWHIDGTTNDIRDVTVHGTLPKNVTFTGRQTSSADSGVEFDPMTNTVTWNISNIPPTLNPESPIYSVAFEVSVTPTKSQAGSQATLMETPVFKGIDDWTHEPLEYPGQTITTSLPDDQLAKGKGTIR